MGSPPGGPERDVPPALLEVTPDSGAVNFRGRDAVFQFDVVVNDRSGGAGGIESLFLVSPSDGTPRVRWRRSRIDVRPRRGFQPNTAYSITMLPGVADLRGNVTSTGRTIVFSTGPVIPPYMAMGRVFDWMSQRVAANAYVEVLRLPDSLRYIGTADSTGQFAVGPLIEGAYVVRAIMDNNRNRATDRDEPWDSVAVTIRGTSPFVELLAAPRDTIAPRLLTVAAPDSVTIVASFDRPLAPELPLTPASFRVFTSDSTRLTITRVRTRAQVDAERAARDSIARLDTARTDTTRVAPPSARAGAPPGARPAQTLPRPVTPGAASAVAQPRPSRPAPPRDVVLTLDSLAPLRAGATYRVVAMNAQGLLGRTRTSDRVLTFTAARRDTSAVPPSAPAAAPGAQPGRPPARENRP